MQQTTFFLALCGLLATGTQATAAPPLPREVSVPAGPHRVAAYLAEPEGSGPFPAVLFLHGGRGGIVCGNPQQSVAALARSGYLALAPLRLQQNTLGKEMNRRGRRFTIFKIYSRSIHSGWRYSWRRPRAGEHSAARLTGPPLPQWPKRTCGKQTTLLWRSKRSRDSLPAVRTPS